MYLSVSLANSLLKSHQAKHTVCSASVHLTQVPSSPYTNTDPGGKRANPGGLTHPSPTLLLTKELPRLVPDTKHALWVGLCAYSIPGLLMSPLACS